MQGGFKLAFTDRFKKDFKRLSPDLRRHAEQCIRDIAKDPIPASRRAHRINTDQFPKVFAVDVTPNKSHKLSFHMAMSPLNVETSDAIGKATSFFPVVG